MVSEKQCVQCGQTKKAKEFYRQKADKSGLQARCKPCDKLRLRARAYGITIERVEELLKNEYCDCCGRHKDEAATVHGFHIDHCHTSGEIRGTLCHYCNVSLGMLRDDHERIRRLGEYLLRTEHDDFTTKDHQIALGRDRGNRTGRGAGT